MDGKVCGRCGVFRPFEDYHRRTASSDGMDYRCKPCRQAEVGKVRSLEDSLEPYVKEGATEILESLGYVVGGPESVYTQFKRRMESKGIDTSRWD